MSLKLTILNHLKAQPSWVHKGELGRLAVTQWGYENENMGRRCRELENEGKIRRKLFQNAKTGVWEAWYKWADSSMEERGAEDLKTQGSIPSQPTSYTAKQFFKDFPSKPKVEIKTLF